MLEATRYSRKWQVPFFTIWTGQQFSLIGSNVVQFAIAWWLAKWTDSASVLMAAFIATLVPQIVLGPFVGALVDRWDRRKVMIFSDAFVAVISLWLAYVFWTGAIQVWHVYVAMLARAVGGVFQQPAMSASTAMMVPERHLSRVAGLNQTIDGMTKIVGPVLGALLIRFMPLPAVALTDTVMAIPAIVSLLFVHIPQPRPANGVAPGTKFSVLSDLKDGLRYMRSWPGMLFLFGIAMVLYFVLAPTSVLAPLLISQHFVGDEFHLASFNALWGIGLVLGGVCLSVWGGFRRRIYTLLFSVLLMGFGFFMIGIAPSSAFWLAMLGNFLVGVTQSMAIGTVYAVLQGSVAPEMQGRVYTVLGAGMVTVPISLSIAGPIADVVGVQPWYVGGGVICMAIGAAAFFIPAVVNVERAGRRASGFAEGDELPPPLMTSEPGSFAQRTIAERKPQIVRQAIEDNTYSPGIVRALELLVKEIASQPIHPLRERAPDVVAWNRALAAHRGKTWLEVPWYFAESYFYRRLLEAVRYFQPGPWRGHDPFEGQKRGQEQVAVERLSAGWGQLAQLGPEVAFEVLLHSCLWGNRADLSNYTVAFPPREGLTVRQERNNLLIDHTDAARTLLSSRLGRVDFINDNVGLDLLFDLALADFLIGRGWAREVVFHLKSCPFFVSDAMPKDVHTTLALLRQASDMGVRALGERLQGCVEGGALILKDDPFWTSWRMFRELLPALREDLGRSDLVILKGDVNYRRLLDDRHWPHSIPLEDIVAYFPASLLVLRTLKSELMVGLKPGQGEALSAKEPNWLLDGKRGVIQLVVKQKGGQDDQ